jgi:hypothetical protein
MYQYGTVYLEGPVAPGERNTHEGYVQKQQDGVTVCGHRDWRGETAFYPWHMVWKIDFRGY